MSQTTVALVAARRKEAKVLALNLALTQEQLVEATNEAATARQELLDQQVVLAAKDAFIAQLQTIIASN